MFDDSTGRFGLPECKECVFYFLSYLCHHSLELKVLAAVVNCVTCSAFVPGSTLYVHACYPRGALPAPGLAGCPVGRGE